MLFFFFFWTPRQSGLASGRAGSNPPDFPADFQKKSKKLHPTKSNTPPGNFLVGKNPKIDKFSFFYVLNFFRKKIPHYQKSPLFDLFSNPPAGIFFGQKSAKNPKRRPPPKIRPPPRIFSRPKKCALVLIFLVEVYLTGSPRGCSNPACPDIVPSPVASCYSAWWSSRSTSCCRATSWPARRTPACSPSSAPPVCWGGVQPTHWRTPAELWVKAC